MEICTSLSKFSKKLCLLCIVVLIQLFRGHCDNALASRQVLDRSGTFHSTNHKSGSFYVDDVRCEKIEIERCQNLGYNFTKMPNVLNQTRQVVAEMELNTFVPLIETNCSKQVLFFLCAVYVPMCNERIPKKPILPCENMCRAVEERCEGIMISFGFKWPEALRCSRFPRQNGNGTLCMEGNEEDAIDDRPRVPQNAPLRYCE